MAHTCQSCGTQGIHGARYCRLCGNPLSLARPDHEAPVSPSAPTIPLVAEDRYATGELNHKKTRRPGAQTSQVAENELDQLLSAEAVEPPPPAHGRTEKRQRIQASAETHSPQSGGRVSISKTSEAQNRSRRVWPLACLVLLSMAVGAGLWSLVRHRAVTIQFADAGVPALPAAKENIVSGAARPTATVEKSALVAGESPAPALKSEPRRQTGDSTNAPPTRSVVRLRASGNALEAATPARAAPVAARSSQPDAHYLRALNIVNLRDPKKLPRAELLHALELFQRARGGRYDSEARAYEDRLGREFDRRKKW